MIWIMSLIFVLLTGIFIFVELHDKPLLALFLKALASFSFLMLLIAGALIYRSLLTSISTIYLLLVISGMILGLIGDVILGLRPLQDNSREDMIIFSGTVAFFTGHLFYIFAISQLSRFYFQSVLFAIVFALVIYAISRLMKINWRKLFIPCMGYTFILFLFVGQTIFSTTDIGNSLFSIVMMIGASLFALSDLVLSQIYFNHNRSKLFVAVNLVMYYLAQGLIAFGFSLLIM